MSQEGGDDARLHGAFVSNLRVLLRGGSGMKARAVFAMGCFWCGEEALERVTGVDDVVSGYCGGTIANPTYRQVVAGGTGHYEAVRVEYDTTLLSYARLLNYFWYNVDPLDARGQFCDKGESYRAAIFYATPEERQAAEQSKAALEQKHSWTIATQILPLSTFYDAEEYHQNYYLKKPNNYAYYKERCHREMILITRWGLEDYAAYHTFNKSLPVDTAEPVDPYFHLKVTLPLCGGVLCLVLLLCAVVARMRRRTPRAAAAVRTSK